MKIKSFCIWLLTLVCSLTLIVQAFGFSVSAASAPARILLDSYEVVEGQVTSGEEVVLRFTFRNASQDTGAVGVMVTYGLGDSGLVPVEGESNQIYISYLGPGESYIKDVACHVLSYQVSDTVRVAFAAYYQDEMTGGTSNEFSIGIPLQEQIEMQIENLELPEEAKMKTQATGHLLVRNTGSIDAYQVVLHCDGAIQEMQKTVQLGDLMSEDSIAIDLNLTFLQDGEQSLSLWLEYQDKDGEDRETTPVVHTVEVESTAVLGMDSTDVLVEETLSVPTSVIVLVAVLILAALLGLWIYFRAKKKNKYVD